MGKHVQRWIFELIKVACCEGLMGFPMAANLYLEVCLQGNASHQGHGFVSLNSAVQRRTSTPIRTKTPKSPLRVLGMKFACNDYSNRGNREKCHSRKCIDI